MTPFALLAQLAGLSQREASLVLSISPAMIDKMSRGTRKTAPGVVQELRALIQRQETTAADALALIKKMDPPEVEIGYPADDHEAQIMGWPCVGAWRAMAARVIAAAGRPVALVPRGSTSGTARAADEAGR